VITTGFRRCFYCKQILPIDSFYVINSRISRHRNTCNKCKLINRVKCYKKADELLCHFCKKRYPRDQFIHIGNRNRCTSCRRIVLVSERQRPVDILAPFYLQKPVITEIIEKENLEKIINELSYFDLQVFCLLVPELQPLGYDPGVSFHPGYPDIGMISRYMRSDKNRILSAIKRIKSIVLSHILDTYLNNLLHRRTTLSLSPEGKIIEVKS